MKKKQDKTARELLIEAIGAANAEYITEDISHEEFLWIIRDYPKVKFTRNNIEYCYNFSSIMQ